MKTRSIIAALPIILSACGITTRDEPGVQANLPIPPGYIWNDVVNPTGNRFSLALICGHLVEKRADGLFAPLGIAAYEAGKAPNIVAASDSTPADYYSLIDSGGQSQLQASYGPGTANFAVSGQNRLEVTVRPVANCLAPNPSKIVLRRAVEELSSYIVNRQNIWYVTSAVHEEMVVNHLMHVERNGSLVATPIVNIGGTNYSKQDQRARRDYISINPVQIDATLLTPIGGSVVSPEPITTSPIAREVLSTAAAPQETPPVLAAQPSVGKVPNVSIVAPDQFLQMRRDILSNPAARVER